MLIKNFKDSLTEKYADVADVLREILGDRVEIHHVGSTALGISGKNIVDILIGVRKNSDLRLVADRLIKGGYYEGGDTGEDRIFLASREKGTRAGDVHIHICVIGSQTYDDFLILRDYLRAWPDALAEYETKKREFAMMSGNNRKEYKRLKSQYVTQLIEKARSSLAQEKEPEY